MNTVTVKLWSMPRLNDMSYHPMQPKSMDAEPPVKARRCDAQPPCVTNVMRVPTIGCLKAALIKSI